MERKLHIGYKQGEHFITDNFVGISPLDTEQFLALQYGLIPRDISIFFLCGGQGSGKTLLALTYALDSVLWYPQEKRIQRGLISEKKGAFFEQVIYMKPPETLGGSRRDMGALPGELYDKLEHHLRPLRDAYNKTLLSDQNIPFEELLRHPRFETKYGPKRKENISFNGAHFPARNPALEIVHSGFIGGSSIANSIVLIDEAQDYTPYEIKTILERLAIGSSAVIMGDPFQTRNPYCSPKKNGLTFALRAFISQPFAGLIWLPRNYRSEVSECARGMQVYNTK
jgi:PhoH-like ATPase